MRTFYEGSAHRPPQPIEGIPIPRERCGPIEGMLTHAHDEAFRRNSSTIQRPDLFVGIIMHLDEKYLNEFFKGVSREEIIERVRKATGIHRGPPPSSLELSPDSKAALSHADAIREWVHEQEIFPLHLLVALTSIRKEGVYHLLLKELGVDSTTIHHKAWKELVKVRDSRRSSPF